MIEEHFSTRRALRDIIGTQICGYMEGTPIPYYTYVNIDELEEVIDKGSDELVKARFRFLYNQQSIYKAYFTDMIFTGWYSDEGRWMDVEKVHYDYNAQDHVKEIIYYEKDEDYLWDYSKKETFDLQYNGSGQLISRTENHYSWQTDHWEYDTRVKYTYKYNQNSQIQRVDYYYEEDSETGELALLGYQLYYYSLLGSSSSTINPEKISETTIYYSDNNNSSFKISNYLRGFSAK